MCKTDKKQKKVNLTEKWSKLCWLYYLIVGLETMSLRFKKQRQKRMKMVFRICHVTSHTATNGHDPSQREIIIYWLFTISKSIFSILIQG